jgi:hypothetical protein
MNDRILAGIVVVGAIVLGAVALIISLLIATLIDERKENMSNMDRRYVEGHVSAQDPEGIQGALYKVDADDGDVIKYLYIDSIEDYRVQYWSFNEDKELIDGGEIDTTSTDPEDILDDVKSWVGLDGATLEKEEDWLDISDLEDWGFTGM